MIELDLAELEIISIGEGIDTVGFNNSVRHTNITFTWMKRYRLYVILPPTSIDPDEAIALIREQIIKVEEIRRLARINPDEVVFKGTIDLN